jgi:Mg2+-importing ATPase
VLSIAVMLVTLVLPYVPFAGWLGFAPLPARVLGTLVAITGLYVVATEMAKRRFYAREA